MWKRLRVASGFHDCVKLDFWAFRGEQNVCQNVNFFLSTSSLKFGSFWNNLWVSNPKAFCHQQLAMHLNWKIFLKLNSHFRNCWWFTSNLTWTWRLSVYFYSWLTQCRATRFSWLSCDRRRLFGLSEILFLEKKKTFMRQFNVADLFDVLFHRKLQRLGGEIVKLGSLSWTKLFLPRSFSCFTRFFHSSFL